MGNYSGFGIYSGSGSGAGGGGIYGGSGALPSDIVVTADAYTIQFDGQGGLATDKPSIYIDARNYDIIFEKYLEGVLQRRGTLYGGAFIQDQTWTLPNATGTIALTSDIPTISGTTNTIPIFTGATAIGDSLLTYNGESFLFSLVGGTVIVDNANGRITLDPNTPQITINDKSDGFAGVILIDTMTANRDWTFPDASGTVALTTDIPTLSLRNVTATDTFATANETINCTANTFTVNLPTAVGIQGTTYTLVNSGTGTITLDPNGTETINGNTTIDLVQYVSRTVQSDGTNWIII